MTDDTLSISAQDEQSNEDDLHLDDSDTTLQRNLPLSSLKRRHLFSLIKQLKISHSSEASGSGPLSDTKRKLSAPQAILNKLGQASARNIPKRLVMTVSKPVINSRLTQLLPFSKFNTQSGPRDRRYNDSVESSRDDPQRSSMNKSGSEENSQTNLMLHQRSSTSSSSLSTPTSLASSLAGSQSSSELKKRRNISQSASIEDALSTIEERLDDDEFLLTNAESKGRVRLVSESNSRRQIERAKEIDLPDDESSFYHADKIETEDPASLSESCGMGKSQSSFSVKSGSTSRSEDTVKAASPRRDHNVTPPTANSLETPRPDSAPKRLSPDAKQNSRYRSRNASGGDTSSNFVQSVRVVKAQQHLLQNMIRHHNQNLVPTNHHKVRSVFIYPNRLTQSEYPFVTFKRFPADMIQSTGGVVSVHSVKLLDHIINDEESETRDIWWTEIRKEINSHAKAVNCNTIIGYRETSKVLGDVCVLSAYGTAAVMKIDSDLRPNSPGSQSQTVSQTLKIPNGFGSSPPPSHAHMPSPSELGSEAQTSNRPAHQASDSSPTSPEEVSQSKARAQIDCSFCHTPMACAEFDSSLANCTVCNASKVPDLLLLTLEPPPNLNIASKGILVQARVCRPKRDSHGEASAKEIGEALPFLEYELHRQLYSKLKFKGMNCLYNLDIDISIGENMISGVATGTGCYVLGLPIPEPPRISGGKGIKTSKLAEIQKLIESSAQKNRQVLGLDEINEQFMSSIASDRPISRSPSPFPLNDSAKLEEGNNAESNCRTEHHNLYHGKHHHRSKQFENYGGENQRNNLNNLLQDDNNIVLEVDDNEDANIVALLIDSEIPDGYTVSNSESTPFIDQTSFSSMNMFTQVMRAKLTSMDQFAHLFDWVLQSLFVKLRRSLPCCLTNITYFVDLPETNVVQISITGCLLAMRRDSIVDSCDSTTSQEKCDQVDSKHRESASRPKVATSTSVSPQTSSSSSSSSPSLSSSSNEGDEQATTSKVVDHNPVSTTSFKSTKNANQDLSNQPIDVVMEGQTEPSKLSLTKQLSKTNIASLINVGRTSFKSQSSFPKKKSLSNATELTELSGAIKAQPAPLGTPKPLSIEADRSQQPVRFMRTVFKKQQTYPGAYSPSISGQDSKLANLDDSAKSQTTALPNATRKATLIFNKVKQPLKDLSSNINATSSSSQNVSDGNTVANFSNKTSRFSKNASTTSKASSRISELKQSYSAHGISSMDINPQPTTTFQQHKHSSNRGVNSSAIDISSLSYVPGAKEYHYLGNLSFSFVRETGSVRENGGLNGFIHCFLMEVYAIVRAHVSALGGNAFLSLRLQQSCILYHSNKNQAQCLISVAGDAVQVTS